MCKVYENTADALNIIINKEIISEGKNFSHEEIAQKLYDMNLNPFHYSARQTVLDRLEHLRALGILKFNYETGQYHRKRLSLRERRKRSLSKNNSLHMEVG